MAMQAFRGGNALIKFISLGLLIMASAGLMFMDVGGYFSGTMAPQTVAKAGDHILGAAEFDRQFRRFTAELNMPQRSAIKAGLHQQFLQQQAARLSLLQEAQDLGIVISDELVAEEVRRFVNAAPIDGSETEKLEVILSSQGITEPQLVDMIRADMAAQIIDSVTIPSLAAPTLLTELLAQYDAEQRRAEVLRLNPNDLSQADMTVTLEAVETVYNARKSTEFAIPERRGYQILMLTPEIITADIEVTEADIKAYFEDNKGDFVTEPSVTMTQVLWAEQTEDFDERVQSFRDMDPKEWMNATRRAIAQPKQAYALKHLPDAVKSALETQPTGLLDVVKSDFGYHLLHVESYTDGSEPKLADVRDTIEKILQQQALDTQRLGTFDELDMMALNTDSLSEIAARFDVEVSDVPPTSLDGDIGGQQSKDQSRMSPLEILNARTGGGRFGGDIDKKVRQQVFELAEGGYTEVMESRDGGLVIAQVTKIIPESTTPLEDVKDKIMAEIAQQQVMAAMRDRALQIKREIDSAGDEMASLAGYADNNNFTLTRTKYLDRLVLTGTPDAPQNQAQDDLSNAGLSQLFDLQNIGEIALVSSPRGTEIDLIRWSGLRLDPAEKITATPETKRALGAELNLHTDLSYMNALHQRTGVQINDALVEQMYNPAARF